MNTRTQPSHISPRPQLTIEGMHCASCSTAVEGALR